MVTPRVFPIRRAHPCRKASTWNSELEAGAGTESGTGLGTEWARQTGVQRFGWVTRQRMATTRSSRAEAGAAWDWAM